MAVVRMTNSIWRDLGNTQIVFVVEKTPFSPSSQESHSTAVFFVLVW